MNRDKIMETDLNIEKVEVGGVAEEEVEEDEEAEIEMVLPGMILTLSIKHNTLTRSTFI